MDIEQAKELFAKYINDECSENEIQLLDSFLDSYQEKQKIWLNLNFANKEEFNKYMWSKIENQILEKKIKRRNSLRNYFKYAAILIIAIGFLGLLHQWLDFKNNKKIIDSENNITLLHENGNIEIINENMSGELLDSNGDLVGNKEKGILVYHKDSDVNKLIYNKIKVPYGKRYKIQLSDGTEINLNAGTSLKYPVKFLKGKTRLVYLNGEAYFNVTKDRKHPFVVNSNGIEVRVLGTKFNVTSYLEDDNINTILEEGLVRINGNTHYDVKTSTILNPGFKAAWNKKEKAISIEKVDVKTYTSWIQGKIIFKQESFNKILKKLERHYNVKIVNNNKSLDKEIITASFDIETIDQVLKAINEIHPINYKIVKNKIIIN
ncbi:Anti-sigma factor [Flavobacterium daejeonense]|nr:Anti-sigma factor [Flavobacterium daejeonense]